jgi:hypothetical protein
MVLGIVTHREIVGSLDLERHRLCHGEAEIGNVRWGSRIGNLHGLSGR